jgi:ribosome-associated protein
VLHFPLCSPCLAVAVADVSEAANVEGLDAGGLVVIPRSELEFRTSRSSGPGGQHVNKTSSRVEILWNVAHSVALSDEQRDLLITRLASRLSENGEVRVVASDTRSQLRNRQTAERRLAELIARSLAVPKKRKPTRKPRAANEARLTEKKKHSDKKRNRQQRAAE